MAPGSYRFTISCDPSIQTSLAFRVPGTPRTFINIQAVVGDTAGPATSNFGGPSDTDTSTALTETTYVYWRAYGARPNTCQFTETLSSTGLVPGTTSFAQSGFLKVALHAGTQQSYSLTCQEADGRWSTVNTQVSVPPRGLPCDIDGDGMVGREDIDLIMGAIGGELTGPDDPRDANRDGVISVADARTCALRCTFRGCTQ